MTLRHGLFFIIAVGFSCAPIEEQATAPAVGVRRDAIFGGTLSNGYPEVFHLIMQFPDGSQGGCSATLIAPRTLLTAAHCVDPRVSGQTSMQIYAHNKLSLNNVGMSDLIPVVETSTHPDWNVPGSSLQNDVGLALLERAPSGVTPKTWNTLSVDGLTGKPLRAVGYGTASADPSTAGVRRQVDLTFAEIYSNLIVLGDGVGKGVCHGDSGGPSFHTFTDGIERVVGVHSFTMTEDCNRGADTRVDAYKPFIQQWLVKKEGPTCNTDGSCKTGCQPVDQDCVCVADNTCNPQCLNLDKDPDCPKNCAKDGICALGTCPEKDADCIAVGQTCKKDTDCLSRNCIRDGQTPSPYCSFDCSGGQVCPSGMECAPLANLCTFTQKPTKAPGEVCLQGQDFCLADTTCAGLQNGPTSCQAPCNGPSDCPPGTTCELGQGSVKFCYLPPPPAPNTSVTPLTETPTQPKGTFSCASVGGSPWVIGAAVVGVFGRLRRRRAFA